MALRTIRTEGDPILRKICRPVTQVDDRTKELIGDGPVVMVNPEILETSGSQTGQEGCLSIPGKAGIVTRPMYVKAKAYDENMNEYEIEGEELMARAICHELAHLDGDLYIDHIEGELMDVVAGEE